jgi:3-oxoacyl-[acyl-carrier protein] reductase
MRGSLNGRVVVITGAAGGIGLACCKQLIRERAHVVLSDVDAERLEAANTEVGGALAIVADVVREDDAAALVEQTVRELGRLDGFVAAAGLYHATSADAIGAEEWDRIQAVNVRGTFISLQAGLRVMVAQRSGAIVTLGSIAGQIGGLQSGAGYATSKAAVIGMTKALARYAGPHGVRVNSVNPGFIETGMGLGISPEDRERTIAATPLGRPGTADEVAEAVSWLLSDAASFVTGTHLDVNGGLHMA